MIIQDVLRPLTVNHADVKTQERDINMYTYRMQCCTIIVWIRSSCRAKYCYIWQSDACQLLKIQIQEKEIITEHVMVAFDVN